MIFTEENARKILAGEKTQTRRLVKPGDMLQERTDGHGETRRWVHDGNNRLRWMVGNTYAVQPGRGKKAVGYIRVIGIRREMLLNISESDALAEGCGAGHNFGNGTARTGFAMLWDSINDKPGIRFFDNPDVWVLTFKLEEEPIRKK